MPSSSSNYITTTRPASNDDLNSTSRSKESEVKIDPEDDKDVLAPFRELHRLYRSQEPAIYEEVLDDVISGKHRKTCKVSLKAHEVWMVYNFIFKITLLNF